MIVELASLLVHQVRNDLLQLGLDLIKYQSKLLIDDAALDLNTTVAWLASLRVVGCINHGSIRLLSWHGCVEVWIGHGALQIWLEPSHGALSLKAWLHGALSLKAWLHDAWLVHHAWLTHHVWLAHHTWHLCSCSSMLIGR